MKRSACLLLLLMSGCSSKISLEEADSLSSREVARTPNCDAPQFVGRFRGFSGKGLTYEWRCKPQADGSTRSLFVDVSETGDVVLHAMTTSADDPEINISIKKE